MGSQFGGQDECWRECATAYTAFDHREELLPECDEPNIPKYKDLHLDNSGSILPELLLRQSHAFSPAQKRCPVDPHVL